MRDGLLETNDDRVRREWIDPNGHMNVAYYTLTFDLATDGLYDYLGVGFDEIAATNCSVFSLEAHECFLRELRYRDPRHFRTQVLDFNDKRMHLLHEMYQSRDSYLAATSEHVALHVDMGARRSVPFSERTLALLDDLKRCHDRLGLPPQAGRSIGLDRERLT